MANQPPKTDNLRIIMDSNSLFVPSQFKVDVFSEMNRLIGRNVEPVLISSVKRELETLVREGSPELRKKAKFALSLGERCTYVKIVEKPSEQTDDAIIRIAKEWNSPVFTNDKALRKKLRDISVPVIYLRQKSRLEVDGSIS
jgi:rRNA-processing protein FCF1